MLFDEWIILPALAPQSPRLLPTTACTMTQNYQRIQQHIEALQLKAERLREKEIDGVVARIKTAIAHYGLTAAQLGYGVEKSSSAKKSAPATKTAGAKYSDGAGHTWGGRGPRPQWLRTALAAGASLEEFAGKSDPKHEETPKATKTSAKRSKRAGKLYQDSNGNTWSGMGPRPKWLKDALAAGATLEQLQQS